VSVSSTVSLPAQPAQGEQSYIPLGGDGKFAPLGCYFCRLEVDGDAGGGTASLTINCDVRYTNLIAYSNLLIEADAAAGDFALRIEQTGQIATPDRVTIVGTIPNVATGVNSDNSSFLWYPPPLFYQGAGVAISKCLNVGVNETYKLAIEVFVFDINVKRLAPMTWLMQNVPGVSAPASI